MPKIVMLSYYTGPKDKPAVKPGDVVDVSEFAAGEADRLVEVRGARAQSAEEIQADADAAAAAKAK